MRVPNFIGGSYRSGSKIADDAITMNFIPEVMESQGAKAPIVLYPAPGFSQFASAVENPVRGLWSEDGRTLAVIGGSLFELLEGGTLTPKGAVSNNNLPVTFATNGDGGRQVFVTSGDEGYIYDLDTNVLSTSVLSNVTFGGFLSSRFLGLDAATSTLKISDQLDGTAWDPTQIAQRTIGSDAWVSMLVNNREIWLFGTRTSEVWYDSGSSPFPFAPVPGAYIQQGIAAPYSAARVANAVMWLGQNSAGGKVVYRSNGYSAERTSDHAMETAINSYARVTDARAWSYEMNGHAFYVLTFPDANATWVFDTTTGMWHNRGYWDVKEGRYKAYRAMWHCYAFGKHLVGDLLAGIIYEMRADVYTDVGGAAIRFMRRGPHIANEQLLITHHLFQLDLEVGLGLSTGQGSDPQVMLRWSDNGGQTWGNEHWRSGGKIGKYGRRVMWRRLGDSRDRIYEVAMTDPIPWRIIDAFMRVSVGNS
jgi:hypothetical protein